MAKDRFDDVDDGLARHRGHRDGKIDFTIVFSVLKNPSMPSYMALQCPQSLETKLMMTTTSIMGIDTVQRSGDAKPGFIKLKKAKSKTLRWRGIEPTLFDDIGSRH